MLWLAGCQPAGPTFLPPTPEPRRTSEATPASVATPTTSEPTAGPIPPLAIAPLTSDEVGRYGLLELEIQASMAMTNPFDPDELGIRVEFTSPSGFTTEIGAFWYQAYDPTGIVPTGEPGWRARFTPTETGTWTVTARIPARDLHSEPASFRVTPSDHPGFVRIHPHNPRYLAFDRGDTFFPIGMNLAWWSGAGDALTDYRKWMDLFAANGGDAIRVWMADWSFGLEYSDTPLGDYTHRLRRAWLLDQVFAMAEQRDQYIMLVLLNCADYNDWQTDGWNKNPYNAARGGPLQSPDQFVTDPTARLLLQRRLTYIVNRWGYSPQLLAWEWWNEVNLAPFTDETLIPWLQEMTAHLRAHDVNRHLVTNSYAIRDMSPIWNLPELDIIQKHEYSDQTGSPDRDLAGRAAADFTRLAASAPPKPILLGEFGYGGEDRGGYIETTGIHLHNGIWATTFVGYAGSGMYWFWDIYVEIYRLWHHFRSLDRFLAEVDLSGYQPFSPLQITGPGGGPGQAVGLGMRGDEEVLIWVRSEGYTAQAAEAGWQQAGSPGAFAYNPPLVEGQVLTLAGMADGEYAIHWFDPQSGTWTSQEKASAGGGRLSIPLPSFRRDLAARIERNRNGG